MEVKDSNRCFVCGRDNERGLKLSFSKRGEETWVEFTPPSYLQGYDGILHGGITSTLLDEVMVKSTGKKVVTVELSVRFLKPVPVGKRVLFRGRVERMIKKVILTSSEVKDTEGNTLAIAKGKYIRLDY